MIISIMEATIIIRTRPFVINSKIPSQELFDYLFTGVMKEDYVICTNNDSFQRKLSKLITQNKSVKGLQHLLKGVSENDSFIVVKHIIRDSFILAKLINKVRALNGEEIIESHKELAYQNIYACYSFGNCSNSIRSIGEKDKAQRVCRFCGKDAKSTTFREKAHAISEALGNKQWICCEECDPCNKLFSETIEIDIVNYLLPYLVTFGITGKKGKRSINGKNLKIISSENKSNNEVPLKLMFKFDNTVKIPNKLCKNGILNMPSLDFSNIQYIPQNVYKCFVKYTLSLIDHSLLNRFSNAICWIKESLTKRDLPYIYECDCEETLQHPTMDIFVNKNGDSDYPFCFSIFRVVNKAFIYIIPFCGDYTTFSAVDVAKSYISNCGILRELNMSSVSAEPIPAVQFMFHVPKR